MAAITALTQLYPPPSDPSRHDWDEAEQSVGLCLPDDYKQVADLYGRGEFNNFITLYQPGGHEEYSLTGPMPRRLREQIKQIWQADPYAEPLPCNVENLLATGVTGNGDYIFWITDPVEDPDSWKITVNHAMRGGWFTFEGKISEFILAVLQGSAQVPMFPRTLPTAGPVFSPAPPERGPSVRVSTEGATTSPKEIRAWARANGYELQDRGRIPPEIVRAWEQRGDG
ncbi:MULTISPECIES: histone-like nucleoid-structuring protein Lsr2 [unclassified Streptomyces]|uniref:Lsr2 family DNA-binding protein n=1 Tax=unclassified Streptomyces TaxID=2593676 RepID=UPI0033B63664